MPIESRLLCFELCNTNSNCKFKLMEWINTRSKQRLIYRIRYFVFIKHNKEIRWFSQWTSAFPSFCPLLMIKLCHNVIKVLWMRERSETWSQLGDRGGTDINFFFTTTNVKKVIHFLGKKERKHETVWRSRSSASRFHEFLPRLFILRFMLITYPIYQDFLKI